jgi:hypothetical protein
MQSEARGEEVKMPESPMRLHPLAPDVKCPACGADLVFVRRRLLADLYECASGGQCRRQVLHYRTKETQTCGYAALYTWGVFGEWTACVKKAAKEKG